MNVGPYLSTKDLADAVQISVQQVRNYEAAGFIPDAPRSPSGYRLYTRQHLTALQAARQLMRGYGVPRTQRIMQAVHAGRRAEALALIDERHAELAALRSQLEQTLRALTLLTDQLPPAATTRSARQLRVSEAAYLAGVRVSALRFWEQQGLLHPVREKGSRYRLYDERQMQRLRIVTLLRQANYDFDAIRLVLTELDRGQPERAVLAIEQRRSDLAETSWHCIEGVVALHAYLREFLDN